MLELLNAEFNTQRPAQNVELALILDTQLHTRLLTPVLTFNKELSRSQFPCTFGFPLRRKNLPLRNGVLIYIAALWFLDRAPDTSLWKAPFHSQRSVKLKQLATATLSGADDVPPL